MPFLALDLQTNYGNLDLVVKEVNKVQSLSDQINYNSSITIEKFAKEIYEKIIETEETAEQQKIDDRKKENENRNNNENDDEYYIYYEYSEEEIIKKEKQKTLSYQGNFINIFK